MPEPVFSRILLKLSGEVLANKHGFGIDPEKVLYLAREIEPVYKSNVNIGLIIGAGIGWSIDQWLNTTPLFLIIFFILGGVAGIYNLWRVLTGKGLKMGFFNEKEK